MGTIWQESFYFDLTEEELNHVHEYNFDHPGKTILFEQFESVVVLVTQTFLILQIIDWLIDNQQLGLFVD